MGRTFEEVAGGEMDALYQGALFLCGGRADSAEGLVVDTIMLAFNEHAADADPERTRRWLEARLVRAFLRGIPDPAAAPETPPSIGGTVDPAAFEGLGPDRLFEAANSLPPGPRAALWLVMMRRWSHSEAAAVMRVDSARMESLLGYRDVLMQELLAGTRRRSRGGM